ncbi:DVUA0089 family protein [Petroclostridium sp. X23]|uniref:DVUA0089 family protein n=1 Tax=Petroclostridium sp. X23 TaxID=3045146 RepID=UPI0024AD8B0D|nr:DVUA0089 family protein [Petroclostridium sp. X23]WHH58740.1 DVUA0089 family protein [Petroclostridium sp. X23]
MVLQKRGLGNLLLTIFLILTLTLTASIGYAAPITDTDNHWAKEVISKWTDKGLVNGYSDGTFKPDKPISRAEFMTFVNKAFGYKKIADMNYTDAPKGAWYEDVISKAKAAGYISGYTDGTIRPDASITRQEAAVVIAKIKELESDPESASAFVDAAGMPDWSKGFIGAVAKAGYMKGYPDGSFKPEKNVTRAEAITALDIAASVTSISKIKDGQLIFDKAGTYGPEKAVEAVDADVIIKADGVILQNQQIHGDLIIAEEVGQGTVTLNNVTVDGDTYVRGGGPNSIVIDGGQYKNIIVQNVNGKVRVVAKGVKGPDGKDIDIVIAEEAAGNEVILNGEFNSINIEASNVVVTTQGDTSIGTMTVSNDVSGTTLNISQGTQVQDLVLNSNVDVKGEGRIQNKTEPPSTPSGGGGGTGGSSSSNNAPAAPQDFSPANDVENVELSPALSWTCSDPDGDALTYDIYFGTDEASVEALDVSVQKAAGQSSTAYAPDTLSSLTIYYWRVVAKDGKGGESKSPLLKFTTINNAPNTPAEPYPSNEAKIVNLSPTLSWTCSDPDGDALTYDIYFASEPTLVINVDTQELILDVTAKRAANQTDNFYTPGDLQSHVTYYWKVVARDSNGEECASPVWQFTTTDTPNAGGGSGGSNPLPSNHVPTVPQVLSPVNEVESVSVSPNLSWTCSDPDGDALTYDVYFGTDETLVNTLDVSVQKEAGYNGTAYLPGELEGLTTYYWKVVAKDEKGGRTDGPLWKFTTKEPEVRTNRDGYFVIENDDHTRVIEGYVTHNRGGAGISGATVTYPVDIFETPGDLLVSINDLAAARVQNVYWKSVSEYVYEEETVSNSVYGGGGSISVTEAVYGWNGQNYIYEVPVRDLFNPSWGETPPGIQLEGITPGATVSGTVYSDLSFESESGIYVYYVYLGGEQRFPIENYGIGGWGENSATVSIDTTSYPNGPTYLKVLAYDYNGNSVLSVLPVIVENQMDPEQNDVPNQIKELNLICDTYGMNWGLYAVPVDQAKILEDDSQNADMNDVTIRNRLTWTAATGADGYKVYRSFDGVNYQQIGTVKSTQYQDASSALEIGKLTYYKVVPYNSQGDNNENALIRFGAPLPGFNVVLNSPKHGATDVELSPTFTWDIETIGGSFEEYRAKYDNIQISQSYNLRLFDATSYLIWEDESYENKYDLTFELEPGGIYSWDINEADCYVSHEYTGNGYSYSISYAADGQIGSLNGENMFATAVENLGADNIPQMDFLNIEDSQFTDGHVLVKSNNMAGLAKTLDLLGSATLKQWEKTGWSMVEVPQDEDVKSFIKKLLKDPDVIIAQPDYLLDGPEPVRTKDSQTSLNMVESGSTDMMLGSEVEVEKLWGLKNIHAEQAWKKTTGSSDVILAIIDTGVQLDHPEFADKIFIGAYDATGEGIPGIDTDGHGTHVAGIAGDNGRNGKIAGVAWDCPIMPIRVANEFGKISTSYLIEATSHVAEYIEQYPDKRIVINMSIGGRGYNFAFKDAIDKALENGVVFVTSAGNDDKRVPSYPTSYNGVIAVAASTPKNTRTVFSTTGPWTSVAAPGEKIYSTLYDPFDDERTYEFMDGTSMASPYVAGAAALLLSEHPELTPAQVKTQLEKTAQGNGFTEELGYGVIDMEAMLGDIQPVDYGSLKVKTNIKETELVTDVGYGVLSIFDKDGNLVSYGTTGENGGHTFHFINPGEYRVVLSYYNPFEDKYRHEEKNVTILSCQTAELEINYEIPSQVEKQDVYTEDIELASNQLPYYYDFTVTQQDEGLFEIETSFFKQNCDTQMALWDENGNKIAYNDDYNGVYSLIRKNLPAGDYTVEVSEFDEDDDLYCTLDIRKLIVSYEN